MAKRILFKENGLAGSGPVPAGYKQIGYDGATFSEKSGFTSSTVGGGGSGLSYKVYTALLTQSGTASPVATVLENTLGYEPVFYRTSTGSYRVDPTTPLITPTFNPSKTVTFIGHNSLGANGSTNSLEYLGIDGGDGTLNVASYDNNGLASDDILSYTSIEIRVYN